MEQPIVTTNPEVASALRRGQAVVALESTIITHGMPYPENAETALSVERVVRDGGAVPATIAVLDGAPTVGLSEGEIDRLGQAGPAAIKISSRDLPFVVAEAHTGGTTVAATASLAASAGIRVFATGGIGGVHRDAATTFDVSADLQEIARTDVAVVCSGVKSILDIGATLEVLETLGVPVLGYGVDRMPAFYCRESRYLVGARVDSPAQVAAILEARSRIGQTGGVVVANPVPAEDALEPSTVDGAITVALAECEAAGVTGKAITPFLLARVAEITGKESLAANISLILHNARLATEIARLLGAPVGDAPVP
ncbi:MAG: pseudouridine-5-phosphate glycosidase [Acidobacteria bacterium]|nr:pseudouridine-5-phosphate glycosidase [Acidobacteriota bacterium]